MAPSPRVKTSADEADARRRPIAARDTRWAQTIARWLIGTGLRPNTISVLSVVCAALGGGALLGARVVESIAGKVALLIFAGVCIQARLLCNLLDGMVAVEGGFRSKSGEIYNELPDRISDALLLVCAGYAAAPWTGWEHDLGWLAAMLAVLTAYVRTLGVQAGASPQFCGPMAKQQRMATLTVACALTAGETLLGWPGRVFTLALGLIALGCVANVVRRTVRIARELERG